MLTNVSKVIALATALLFLHGCKITQVVPLGGSIESRTGANDCAVGQTCVIEVDGVAFDDTFTAVPEDGYLFAGWKPGLCSGSTAPCALEGVSSDLTSSDTETYLEPIFELELALESLLPASTRGVFQVYPGSAGAMDTSASSAAWALGPLQILHKYSAGMDIASSAHRLVLAQLGDAPNQFILLAELVASDVATLTAGADLINPGSYQGYPVWTIGGTGLQLAQLDDITLVIAPQAALELALDVNAGAHDSIALGPLADYLQGLRIGEPNSLVYGLPALYGAVTAPGSGDASLSQADVLSASFAVESGVLSGWLAFYTPNAQTFQAKMLEELEEYTAPAIVAFGDITAIDLTGLSVDDDIRPLLKTLFLDMDAVDYAGSVAHGANQPYLNFKVGESPNSIFVNFEFKDQQARDDFTADHLPAGFTLAPIRILDAETPRYYLVLNLYQSSGGLVTGARAEWSVFVADPVTGEPRFLVIQAAAESFAADSVNMLTFPEPVTHQLTETAIASYVGEVDPVTDVETLYFSSSIAWPQVPETRVAIHREFVVANDYIFWGNGVADRALYNSTQFNREMVLVDAAQLSFTDSTPWAVFVDENPVHTLVYLNPLEIIVSPWWNLDELYLDLTEEFRTELITFKNNFYPGLIKGNASAAIRGEGLALSSATVSDSVPTARYHFPLLDAGAFLTEIAGPGVYTPLELKLFEGDAAADHYLTLSIYQRENDPCGIRVEWATYIVGADGRPDSLRLDSFAAESCLDPVSLMTVATEVSQTVDGESNSLETQVSSLFMNFMASVDLAASVDAVATLEWLETGDRVCSLNDICDEFYVEGQHVLEPASLAEPLAVQITNMVTPWDDYIDAAAVRASVRQVPAIQALNPWRNLRSFAGESAAP